MSDLLSQVNASRARLQALGLAETDLPFFLQAGEFRTACLLLHGSAASPCNNRPLAQQLFGMGYAVYAPLLAGHHDLAALQRGETSWLDCYHAAADALQALRAGFDAVYVVGSSFGGTLAYLLGVEQGADLAGVVALSAPAMEEPRWQPTQPWMREVKQATAAAAWHVRQLHRPTLVMHGVDDPHVRVDHALTAYPLIPARRKKLSLYNGIGHALGFGFNTAEVAQEIDLFIRFNHAPVPVQLRVADQGYQQVLLAGEFTAWRASVPFVRTATGWQCDLMLEPGAYQYKLVLDGQWRCDPQGESVLTPHGEMNSLLRVSRH